MPRPILRLAGGSVYLSDHARRRMAERGVSVEDIRGCFADARKTRATFLLAPDPPSAVRVSEAGVTLVLSRCGTTDLLVATVYREGVSP